MQGNEFQSWLSDIGRKAGAFGRSLGEQARTLSGQTLQAAGKLNNRKGLTATTAAASAAVLADGKVEVAEIDEAVTSIAALPYLKDFSRSDIAAALQEQIAKYDPSRPQSLPVYLSTQLMVAAENCVPGAEPVLVHIMCAIAGSDGNVAQAEKDVVKQAIKTFKLDAADFPLVAGGSTASAPAATGQPVGDKGKWS